MLLIFTQVSWLRKLATTTSSSLDLARRILNKNKNENNSIRNSSSKNELKVRNGNGTTTAESSDDEVENGYLIHSSSGSTYSISSGYTNNTSRRYTNSTNTTSSSGRTSDNIGNELLWSLLDKDKQCRP